MASIHVEHVFECTPEVFWDRIFFDAEFNRAMYLNRLGYQAWRQLEIQEDEASIRRVIELVPPLGELPGAIKKLIGEGFGYREEGRFDKKTKRYEVRAIPNRLADKLSVNGELWCEPVGATSVRRIFDGTVTANVFGVGGLIENRIVADMRRGYDDAARCSQEHLAELAKG